MELSIAQVECASIGRKEAIRQAGYLFVGLSDAVADSAGKAKEE